MEVKEVVFERTYNAPKDLVWKTWTTPELVKQWWGPDNVTIPDCEIDLKVGGTIYIVMEAGEAMGPYKGIKWPMKGQFTIVDPTSHLVYDANAWTEGQENETQIKTTTDISFDDLEGKTKVTVKATIHEAGPGAQMAVQGMQMGWNQQLDKLESFLNK